MKGYTVDHLRCAQARLAVIGDDGEALSQVAAARLLGVHNVTLNRVENGNQRVSIDLLERMVELYGRSREWLLGEPEQVDEFELARERLQNAAVKIADGLEEASLVLDLMREVRTTHETAGRDSVRS